jgi:hypothetical protein
MSEVAVFKGSVEVKNVKNIKQKPVMVNTAQRTIVKKDRPAEKPKKLDEKNFDEWAARIEKDPSYKLDDSIKW